MKLSSIIMLLSIAILTSCTDNEMARNFGGTETIKLDANLKLVTITWKETQIWYLTRPMRVEEQPETLTFKEKSGYGMVEGTIIIIESKQ